jgi:hypothetical protein
MLNWLVHEFNSGMRTVEVTPGISDLHPRFRIAEGSAPAFSSTLKLEPGYPEQVVEARSREVRPLGKRLPRESQTARITQPDLPRRKKEQILRRLAPQNDREG